jgi:carbonic anhydrase/acetyltransferase-like protein (isoleucine patch superfamily)
MNFNDMVASLNALRRKHDFLTIEEVVVLAETNTIFDPFSVLIGVKVKIGIGNCIYPNVTLEPTDGAIAIGDNNTLHSGLRIVAKSGEVRIGSSNWIGENQALIQCAKTKIHITDFSRIMNGAIILDDCYLGKGSQVVGNIKMTKCYLGDGESFLEKNPNLRGGVLKGFGMARDVRVNAGSVINGQGTFNISMIEMQETYHPYWKNQV